MNTTALARLHIGCAGWSLPREQAHHFPVEGSHLERYAQRFSAVEINSSFYRPHRPATYARWAEAVPKTFRFAVKMPRSITHAGRLVAAAEPLQRFLDEAQALGEKLGPLLVQLPPSLPFSAVAGSFFEALRQRFAGEVVCEPRHPSWFQPGVARLLIDFRVAQVAADPAVVPAAAEPGGWEGLVYFRLHGSPHLYHSSYSEEYLDSLWERLRQGAAVVPTWCILDNTALGAALLNGLDLVGRLARQSAHGDAPQ